MNFITYINQLGSFKTSLIEYDPLNQFISTQNPIHEDYLVTSVFVDGVKRSVDIDNVVQLAVINDNNFDGNLLELNHYNISGTYFTAVLLPLPSVGGGGESSVVSSPLFYGKVRPLIIASGDRDGLHLQSIAPDCLSDPLRKSMSVRWDIAKACFSVSMMKTGSDGVYGIPYFTDSLYSYLETDSRFFRIDDINLYISSFNPLHNHEFVVKVYPTHNLVYIMVNNNELDKVTFGKASTLSDTFDFVNGNYMASMSLSVDWKAFPYCVD